MIQAEVRRLARALAPHRVLQTDALRRTTGVDSWRDAGFDRATSAAVEAAKVRPLPAGFYPVGDDAPQTAGS